MFIANLNVFIAILAGVSYLLAWLLDIPVSRMGAYHGFDGMVALMLAAAVLVIAWAKWGLTPRYRLAHQRLYMAGQVGVAISSAIFVRGITMSLHATASGIEEEYWCWVYILDRIAPSGAVFFIASMGMIFASHIERPSAKRPKLGAD